MKRLCDWRGCKSLADVQVLRSFEDGYFPCYYCKGHYDAMKAHKCFGEKDKVKGENEVEA